MISFLYGFSKFPFAFSFIQFFREDGGEKIRKYEKKERKKEKENGKIKGQKKSDFFFMPSWIIVYGSLGGLKGIKRRIDARKSRGGGSGGGGGGGGRGGG